MSTDHDSIFERDLLYLAKQAVQLPEKTAFVGAGDPAAGGAPPQDPSAAGGAPPQDPSAAAGPPGGGDPTGGAGGDPTAPDPMEVRLQSLEQKLMASGGGAGGGAAGGAGGGKNQKAEDSMLLRQLVNMMAVLFARQGWEVPPQVMMPESVSGIPAGSPQVQQVVDQTQQGADGQQQGPESVLSGMAPPGPPQSITPLSSVLGSPGGGGDAGSAGGKSGSYAGHPGIAVSAETLKLAGTPSKPRREKKAAVNEPPDILDLLDLA
jgi:hypothetical protein